MDISFFSISDVDAKFSRISTHLKRKDAKTLPELTAAIQGSTSDMAVKLLPCVYNIRDWIKAHILDASFVHVSQPHQFRWVI